MDKHHFEVITDKHLYIFEEQCNKVDYSNEKYLMLFNSSEEGDRLLAMLPHELVKEVLSVKNSEDK